jgi:glutaredoxin
MITLKTAQGAMQECLAKKFPARHAIFHAIFTRQIAVDAYVTFSLMSTLPSPRPFLYVKANCPWCDEAEEYLKEHGIAYGKAEVDVDPVAFDEMKRLSGQTKAPTMRWGEEILADFGADELDVFLRERNMVR